MKKIISLLMALTLLVGIMAGCSSKLTEEEQAAKDEAAAMAAAAEEEAETGIRRLTSPNLESYEIVLRDFVAGLQAMDTAMVAKTLGVPDVFGDGLYGWVIANGYESIAATHPHNIKVYPQKEDNKVRLDVEINGGSKVRYYAVFEGSGWYLAPPAGVTDKFTFSAATRRVSCGDMSLSEYAISANENGTLWSFSVPRMPIMDVYPAFTVDSNLGSYNSTMYETNSGFMLLADFSAEQETEQNAILEGALNSVYALLKAGASETEVAQLLLQESLVKACFPKNEDDRAAYLESVNTVNSVTVYRDDMQKGYPDAYTYRLAGEDGDYMSVKLLISTTAGDSRQKATILVQNHSGTWKVVSVTMQRGGNPFTNFSIYDPAW